MAAIIILTLPSFAKLPCGTMVLWAALLTKWKMPEKLLYANWQNNDNFISCFTSCWIKISFGYENKLTRLSQFQYQHLRHWMIEHFFLHSWPILYRNDKFHPFIFSTTILQKFQCLIYSVNRVFESCPLFSQNLLFDWRPMKSHPSSVSWCQRPSSSKTPRLFEW